MPLRISYSRSRNRCFLETAKAMIVEDIKLASQGGRRSPRWPTDLPETQTDLMDYPIGCPRT